MNRIEKLMREKFMEFVVECDLNCIQATNKLENLIFNQHIKEFNKLNYGAQWEIRRYMLSLRQLHGNN